MKTILILLIFVSSLFSDLYYINNSLSNVKFEVTQFLFIKINGEFKKFEGNIILEDKELIAINGNIETSSLFTNIKARDNDLKSSSYFEVKKYNSISFQSISLSKEFIVAKLNIKDISKNIKFNINNILIEDDFIKINISSIVNMNDFNLDGTLSIIMNKDVKVSALIYAERVNK